MRAKCRRISDRGTIGRLVMGLGLMIGGDGLLGATARPAGAQTPSPQSPGRSDSGSTTGTPKLPEPSSPAQSPSTAAPQPAEPAAPTYPSPAAPAPSDYKLDEASKKLTFHYSTRKNLAGTFDLADGKSGSEKLVIKWTSASGEAPRRIGVSLKFVYGKNKVEIAIPISGNPPVEGDGNGQYVIPRAKLDEVARILVEKINNMKGGFDADSPLTFDTPAEITVTPDDAGGAKVVQPVKLPDTSQVTMKHTT